MSELKSLLVKETVPYPYQALNNLVSSERSRLLHEFTNNVLAANEKCFSSSVESAQGLKTLSLIDYFKPNFSKVSPLIYLVLLDLYPEEWAKTRDLKLKQNVLASILAPMFYQHYLHLTLGEEVEDSRGEFPYAMSHWDMKRPGNWFAQARKMRRKIVMHVGPTNSGKTYSSLKAFATAPTGYYAGPLRLLAREIYERFQKNKIGCNLITGEEVIPSFDKFGNVAGLSSGTIEMIPLHKKFDVCVIDEIQMLGDPQRGPAWTNALLGVQAKELHLCGEESAVDLVKEIVKQTGDDLEIKKYTRLGKLTVQKRAVERLTELQKGDCLVAFSKKRILELKCRIESLTNFKVAVIYGSLPSEIRSQQTQLFNSGQADVLVASDAVGMGLNLKIRRIIFSETKKFNGKEMAELSTSTTKQIAGRAGRYSATQGELEGFVNTLKQSDLRFVRSKLQASLPAVQKAFIWPPNEFWVDYVSSHERPQTFTQAFRKFYRRTQSADLQPFILGGFTAQLSILELLEEYGLNEGMTMEDQMRLAAIPLNLDNASPQVIQASLKMFDCIRKMESNTALDMGFLYEKLIMREPSIKTPAKTVVDALTLLESNHKLLLVFMWLAQRWPTLFIDRESAADFKTLIEKRICEELACLRAVKRSK